MSRLRAWLVKRKVRSADDIAGAAVVAAKAQQTVVPGQDVAATIVAELAAQLPRSVTDSDWTPGQLHLPSHPQAEIIESLPGMGPILGAELIAAAGDLNGYVNAGRLASAAGWSLSRETPDGGPGTCIARCVTHASCDGCSTCPHRRP